MSESEIRESLQYVQSEIEEAMATGVVNSFTIDTNSLIRYDVDGMDDHHVESEFEGSFSKHQKRELFNSYDTTFKLPSGGARTLSYSMDKSQLMRLAVKFDESIRYGLEIYRVISDKMDQHPFGIEIAFDESNYVTRDDELFFYLKEWRRRGGQVNFVAPNVGFEKRKDYDGTLDELRERILRYHTVAGFYGASLSFHSGSGYTAHGGKGPGVYEAILNGTGGCMKYMISGVYMELVFELFSSFPPGSDERTLYERVFDEVHAYLANQLAKAAELCSRVLADQLTEYEEEARSGKRKERDPRSDFFRHYSFLALNMRDDDGKRFLRQSIGDLYRSHNAFRNLVDHEVEALTMRLIDGLNFANNSSRILS